VDENQKWGVARLKSKLTATLDRQAFTKAVASNRVIARLDGTYSTYCRYFRGHEWTAYVVQASKFGELTACKA
jgi:hypothetical protein